MESALTQFEDFVTKKIKTEKWTHKQISDCLSARYPGEKGFSVVKAEKWTHKQISDCLSARYPGEKGFSVRSVQRFCSNMDIHKTSRISDCELHEAVATATNMVGPCYGRKTMTGLLAAQGVHVSQNRVGEALKHTNSSYHHKRSTSTARMLNPIQYHADYFGHKLHIDQNEKLAMFGVTHVCAIDGFSGKVVQFVTMPVKNNLEIYEHLFRPAIIEYGMWDQIRVDHGKEFVLSLYVQEKLEQHRTNRTRAPHLQTSSKQNHPVERIWVEINSRVNYPVKACLIQMEENGEIDMASSMIKFCISWFSIRVCSVGTTLAIKAWNKHPIPGRRDRPTRIPNQAMLANSQVAKVDTHVIPTVHEAVQSFEQDGGHLTQFSLFGEDPLTDCVSLLEQRTSQFYSRFSSFDTFFHQLVNGRDSLFKNGLNLFIYLTSTLSTTIK